MKYIHLGPWPGYLGVTTSPATLKRELTRLKVKESVPFLTGSSDASTHVFERPDGQPLWIITASASRLARSTGATIAALMAHEAVHVMHDLQRQYAQGKSLGEEADAYLVQYIAVSATDIVWKELVRQKRKV